MDLKTVLNVLSSIILLFVVVPAIFFGGLVLCMTLGDDPEPSDPENILHEDMDLSEVPNPSPSNHSSVDGERLEDEIHHKINDKRASLDRERLRQSERVRRIARIHSKNMATEDFFSHSNPNGNEPMDRHKTYSGCLSIGENIIFGDIDGRNIEQIAERFVERWVDSEGHYETLKRQRYNISGVGVYVTEDGTIYATQNFCRQHPDA